LVIEGTRLYLRPLTASDATEQYMGWLYDPEVTRYLEVRHNPPASIQELEEYIESEPGQLFWAIILKDGGQHIGNIKVGYSNDVGILIGEKDKWGKGYGSEAIRLLTRHALTELGFPFLWAGCNIHNIASWRAFARAGWVLDWAHGEEARYFTEGEDEEHTYPRHDLLTGDYDE